MSEKEKFFLKASRKIWGEQLDYSLVDYKGQRKEIILTCIKHQIEFQQTPNSNLNGVKGCWKCSRKPKNSDHLKELLYENFHNKYDYSKVEYDGKKTTRITLNCHEHGDFTRSALELINGKHCKRCMTGMTRKDFVNYTGHEARCLDVSAKHSIHLLERSSKPGRLTAPCLDFMSRRDNSSTCLEY